MFHVPVLVGGRTASAIVDQCMSELRSMANERLSGKKKSGGGGGGGGKVNINTQYSVLDKVSYLQELFHVIRFIYVAEGAFIYVLF